MCMGVPFGPLGQMSLVYHRRGGWAASACICRGTCNTYLGVITVLFARLVHALGAT